MLGPEKDLMVKEAPGEGEWALVQDFTYRGKYQSWRVHKGFVTDFASSPKFLWALFPPTGKYTRAAVIHDFLYTHHCVPRKDADGIFRRIMRECGVSKWRRYLMWLAVRTCGGFYWTKKHSVK